VALNERIIEDLLNDIVVAKESIPSKKLLNTNPRVLALIEDVLEHIENIDGTVGCLIRLVPNLCDLFLLDLYLQGTSISDAYLDIDLVRELFPTASSASGKLEAKAISKDTRKEEPAGHTFCKSKKV